MGHTQSRTISGYVVVLVSTVGVSGKTPFPTVANMYTTAEVPFFKFNHDTNAIHILNDELVTHQLRPSKPLTYTHCTKLRDGLYSAPSHLLMNRVHFVDSNTATSVQSVTMTQKAAKTRR